MCDVEKACTLCNSVKKISEFYTKGTRIESKCKECAKALRKKRYKDKKKQRNKTGRLMEIKKLTECHIKEKEILKFSKNTLDEILKTHLVKVISGSYEKGKKNAT